MQQKSNNLFCVVPVCSKDKGHSASLSEHSVIFLFEDSLCHLSCKRFQLLIIHVPRYLTDEVSLPILKVVIETTALRKKTVDSGSRCSIFEIREYLVLCSVFCHHLPSKARMALEYANIIFFSVRSMELLECSIPHLNSRKEALDGVLLFVNTNLL